MVTLLSRMLPLFAQSRPTLCNPMVCILPDSSVHGDSPGKNTEVGCHSFLQGLFPTQGSSPGLLNCRQTLLSESSGKPALQNAVELSKVTVTNSKAGYGRWLSLPTNFLLNLIVYWIHLLFSVPFVNNITMTINE